MSALSTTSIILAGTAVVLDIASNLVEKKQMEIEMEEMMNEKLDKRLGENSNK